MEHHRIGKSPKVRGRSDYVMEVVKDLTCPICLEFYTHPIILPCSHVLCRRPCAENLFEVNFIRCPVCRDNCYVSGGITGLPRVITIESIIEKIRAERKKRAVVQYSKRDSSSEDILSDVTLIDGHEQADYSPIMSPAMGISTNLDVTSRSTTPNRLSPSCVVRPSRNHSILPLLNIPMTLPDRTLDILQTSGSCSCYSSQGFTFDRQDNHRRSSSSDSDVTCMTSSTGTLTHTWVQSTNYHLDESYRDVQSTSPADNTFNENHSSNSPQTMKGEHGQNNQESAASRLKNSSSSRGIPGETREVEERETTSILNTSDNGSLTTPLSAVALEEMGVMKADIQDKLQKLCDLQCRLLVFLTSFKDEASNTEFVLDKWKAEINSQCDSLVAEVEHKRDYFLSSAREKNKYCNLEHDMVTSVNEQLLMSSQQLATFAEKVLESRPEVFLRTAPEVIQRLATSINDCQLCVESSEPREFIVSRPCLDLRNERSFLGQMDFLRVPARPCIDAQRCSRNHETVALVLVPPSRCDVIDSYEIFYCSEEQKRLGIEERYNAQCSSPTWETCCVLLIHNLRPATHYFFSACAVNKQGRSPLSEYVQCVTLNAVEAVVPVPAIMEKLCHPHATSLDICCPSPTHVMTHQAVSHFLLHRPVGGVWAWLGEELATREEHEVKGLRPSTEYELVVLARNTRGECQVSVSAVMCTKIID